MEKKNYLKREEIYDLIDSVIRGSYLDGIFNPLVVETLFHVNFYKIISCFTEGEEKANPYDLYDKITQNGEIEKVISHPCYSSIKNLLEQTIETYEKRNNSMVRAFEIMQQSLEEMKSQTANLQRDINGFDLDKVKEIQKMVKTIEGQHSSESETK